MSLPRVEISPKAAQRVRNFDLWVFRDELRKTAESVPSGELVEVVDGGGSFVARAFYNARSHIALRVLATDPEVAVDRALFAERIAHAIARRRSIGSTNAKRLVFSEADELPGLIVDQYADSLVIQIRSAGMERWKATVVDCLRDQLSPTGILERSDKEFREDEGLPTALGLLFGVVPERIEIEEHGLRFLVDPYRGQKTGFYLDQRETRRQVLERVKPTERLLDAFAYTGAFGIAAASRGGYTVCVEREEAFIELAREHARLNRTADRMQFIAGDAFYWLEAAASRGERFDWVILDPPALAKSKADVLKARQALHHLVSHALLLTRPGGTLVLSVCTYHLLSLVEEIVRIAASDNAIRLWIIGQSDQAPDHPWILQMPQTRYLRSWFARRDEPSAA